MNYSVDLSEPTKKFYRNKNTPNATRISKREGSLLPRIESQNRPSKKTANNSLSHISNH